MCKTLIVILIFLNTFDFNFSQTGPDPWDESSKDEINLDKNDVPPDLRILKRKQIINVNSETNQGMSDWFFKRLLVIILKGGQNKENDDNTIDISLQMKYTQEQLNILDEYIKSSKALTEDKFRRSLGYIEESIYKPTITDKIAMAWSEYIYANLVEYKDYIIWSINILLFTIATFWLWHYISYKHILILIGIGLYFYEVFISFKEAEKEEVNRFLSAMSACKWYFWRSDCEVPAPDPLVMLKYMNPLKIAVRMFTTIISEPMITISDTISTMLQNITADLIYPLNIIVKVILVLILNGLLIMLFVSTVLNFILNIPFELNFFRILSIGLGRQRTTAENPVQLIDRNIQHEQITGETLNKFLDICSKALTVTQSTPSTTINTNNCAIKNSSHSLKKSASTGRLPELESGKVSFLVKNQNNK